MFDFLKKPTPVIPTPNGVRFTMIVHMGSEMNFRKWTVTSDYADADLESMEPSATLPQSPYKRFYDWYRDEAADRTQTFALHLGSSEDVVVFDRSHITALHFMKTRVHID